MTAIALTTSIIHVELHEETSVHQGKTYKIAHQWKVHLRLPSMMPPLQPSSVLTVFTQAVADPEALTPVNVEVSSEVKFGQESAIRDAGNGIISRNARQNDTGAC